MAMTRQRAWQIKQQREGRCILCGRPVAGASKLRCRLHLDKARQRYQKLMAVAADGSPRRRSRAGRPRTEDLPKVAMSKITNLQRTLQAMHSVDDSARNELVAQLRACLSRIAALDELSEQGQLSDDSEHPDGSSTARRRSK